MAFKGLTAASLRHAHIDLHIVDVETAGQIAVGGGFKSDPELLIRIDDGIWQIKRLLRPSVTPNTRIVDLLGRDDLNPLLCLNASRNVCQRWRSV